MFIGRQVQKRYQITSEQKAELQRLEDGYPVDLNKIKNIPFHHVMNCIPDDVDAVCRLLRQFGEMTREEDPIQLVF